MEYFRDNKSFENQKQLMTAIASEWGDLGDDGKKVYQRKAELQKLSPKEAPKGSHASFFSRF
jgi:hypothetical protein